MGNSEVGHLNIGAGRVVMQELPRISQAAKDGSLARAPALTELIAKMQASGGTCHLLGLMSPGGVHSHQDHAVVWVYDWFPPFEHLRAKGILRAFADGAYFGPRRLERARRAAMAWVKNNVVTKSIVLPPGFRVPIAYKVNGYRDYELFAKLNSIYELSADNLALAASLHRGISYQARAVSQSGWSYLPHSFRATLLLHPTLSAVAPFCDSERFPVAHEQRAHEIIQSVGEVLTRAVQDSVSITPIASSLVVGGAFHQSSPMTPRRFFPRQCGFATHRQDMI